MRLNLMPLACLLFLNQLEAKAQLNVERHFVEYLKISEEKPNAASNNYRVNFAVFSEGPDSCFTFSYLLNRTSLEGIKPTHFDSIGGEIVLLWKDSLASWPKLLNPRPLNKPTYTKVWERLHERNYSMFVYDPDYYLVCGLQEFQKANRYHNLQFLPTRYSIYPKALIEKYYGTQRKTAEIQLPKGN